MACEITKVAIAGATGNLGPAILEQLLAAGFEVTALTRAGSTHTFPASVRVAPVDYDSLESLVSALRGQDAVVSTLASAALAKQLLLVEAAAQAGVRRFIPSDFGSNTVHPKAAALPAYADKVAVQRALQEKAAAAQPGGLSYTVVLTGPFLDWGLKVGFVLDVGRRHAVLYDGGERVFSTTTLPTIGRAVVGVLRKPEETRNRAVYVHDTATTLRALYELGKKATPGETWTEEVVRIEDELADAWAELKKEQPDPAKFVVKFYRAAVWGEGYGAHFETTDNELLGIKELTEEELQAIVSRYA